MVVVKTAVEAEVIVVVVVVLLVAVVVVVVVVWCACVVVVEVVDEDFCKYCYYIKGVFNRTSMAHSGMSPSKSFLGLVAYS